MKLAALALLVACGRSQPPSATGSGSGSNNAVDLLTRSTVSDAFDVAPGRPFSKELDVFSPSLVTITVTHASGSKGPFTLAIYDARATVPISSDSMTCAEPGCSIRAEVDVAPSTTRLVVRVEATTATSLKLEITAATK